MLQHLHEAVCASSSNPQEIIQHLDAQLRSVAGGGVMCKLGGHAASHPKQVEQHQTLPDCRKRRAGSKGVEQPGKRHKAATEATPEWAADGRPGVWADAEWYLQQHDVVFMQVSGVAAKDRATFTIECSTDGMARSATVWMFRVDEVLQDQGVLLATFYYNLAHDLQQPLKMRAKAERVRLCRLQGIMHTLAPDSNEGEVLDKIDEAVFA
eukprot:gene1149-1490_t